MISRQKISTPMAPDKVPVLRKGFIEIAPGIYRFGCDGLFHRLNILSRCQKWPVTQKKYPITHKC